MPLVDYIHVERKTAYFLRTFVLNLIYYYDSGHIRILIEELTL